MENNNQLKSILALLGAVTLGVVGMWFFGPKPESKLPAQTPLISLEKMGHLVSVKVNYADVIEFTEQRTQEIPWTQWELNLGGTKVLLIARGDCTIATNLRAAKYQNIDAEKRTFTLLMPEPKPMQIRVNHEPREKGGSYFYAITSEGLEPLIPDSSNRSLAINNSLAFAQKQIERSCNRPQIIAIAKKNAEDVLSATFQATGWKPTYVWN
jgi:hypothetical protein